MTPRTVTPTKPAASRGLIPAVAVTADPVIDALTILHMATGFKADALTVQQYRAVLSSYPPDVLRWAALEYGRQRGKMPEAPGALGQFASWILRAIRDGKSNYARRPADEFARTFLAGCAPDTLQYIRHAADNPPRAEEDDDAQEEIETTRKQLIDNQDRRRKGQLKAFADPEYARQWQEHLEG